MRTCLSESVTHPVDMNKVSAGKGDRGSCERGLVIEGAIVVDLCAYGEGDARFHLNGNLLASVYTTLDGS